MNLGELEEDVGNLLGTHWEQQNFKISNTTQPPPKGKKKKKLGLLGAC
jgi:hypothetical protein